MGVDEDHPDGFRLITQSLFEHPDTHLFEFLQHFVQVVHCEGDVVDPLAFAVKESCDGRLVVDRFQQFNSRLSRLEGRHLHPFPPQDLSAVDRQAQQPIELRRYGNGARGNADMQDTFDHTAPPFFPTGRLDPARVTSGSAKRSSQRGENRILNS
ncbi:MAG TPA: hypothetical protein P5568_13205 [Acidobacteriota bacterium]|nr:hypothetical protein [Acidobacteriota bacterium]